MTPDFTVALLIFLLDTGCSPKLNLRQPTVITFSRKTIEHQNLLNAELTLCLFTQFTVPELSTRGVRKPNFHLKF